MMDLEKQLRVLQKKLERSERNRVAIEDKLDHDQLMYKAVHAEVSAAREMLEKANQELKKTQAQLVQQEKLASLGQLTAGIAHEIKNPLNFINNFAEINTELALELREAVRAGDDFDDLLADLEQNTKRIGDHGKRVDAIVQGMMRHASGGSGNRTVTPVNELVLLNVDLAYHGKRSQSPDLKVEITRDMDDEAGSVEMVPEEIARVVLNLLGNAFDAVQEHLQDAGADYAPVVTVSTRRLDRHVEIRVSDNGPGVPAEIREKIFEPFFTTKPTGKGTGLGLSLSYDLITQGHGGTFSVESGEGEGATFVIRLPAPAIQKT